MPATHRSIQRTELLGANDASRAGLVRRGLRLNYITIGYNAIEAAASLAVGLLAGSVALVGFGLDSAIEVTASGAAQWRLRTDWDAARRDRVEQLTSRVVGSCFLALAAYIVYESATSIWRHEAPQRSVLGMVIVLLSAVVMPVLARSKRRVAVALQSGTLLGEATQTSLCAYLSVIALFGLALNALLGWWWADPVAALGLVPLIVREGIQGLRGEGVCERCAGESSTSRT